MYAGRVWEWKPDWEADTQAPGAAEGQGMITEGGGGQIMGSWEMWIWSSEGYRLRVV